MKRVFVDANVLIDVIASREPFCEDARKLLAFACMGDFELWTSTALLPILSYVASGGKRSNAEEGKRVIRTLRASVRFAALGERQAEAALDSAWEDVEDALVYQAAAGIGADVLVTRNKRDFGRASMPVMDAREFFTWLRSVVGIAYAEIHDGAVAIADRG